MKITKEFLHEKGACEQSYKWVCENKLIGLEHEEFIDKLMKNNRFSDANWLLTKLFDETQCVKYAVFAAEQVLDIFEKKYPDDDRPRKAIEAAKDDLKSPNDVTYAADVAYAAEAAAYAAAYAADAAARAAARAAAYAADVARAAEAAAYAAAYAARAADVAAYAAVEIPIINYGLVLLKS